VGATLVGWADLVNGVAWQPVAVRGQANPERVHARSGFSNTLLEKSLSSECYP
jgi:hypothetical protein